MKRYLAFAGDTYYPAGGWDDFKGDFDTKAEAYAAVCIPITNSWRSHEFDWWQVIDTTTKADAPQVELEQPNVS